MTLIKRSLIQLFFVGIAMFGLTTTSAYGQTSDASSTSAPTTEVATTSKTIKVKVKGVGCSRDIQAILNNVGSVIGVRTCKTLKKGATTTFSVTYNPSMAKEESIYSAVESTPGCSNQSARPYKVKL